MTDLAIYAVVAGSAFLVAFLVQGLVDRRREKPSMDNPPSETPPSKNLATPEFSPAEEISWSKALTEFPFLAALPVSELAIARSARVGGALHLLSLAPSTGPIVGYTLLARRAPAWSSRAVVRAPSLVGGPATGTDQDPRRAAELARPELIEALTEADAWLQIEGPWRVVGVARACEIPEIAALAKRLFALVPEPDEFSGGLEWNI